jgi:sugar lactone lactonase YvrE
MKFKAYSLHILAVVSIVAVVSTVEFRGDTDGLVAVFGKAYQPAIEVSEDTGLVAPDGLSFRDGKLYIADEGLGAVHVWDGGELRTLCDRAAGLRSPEALVVNAGGSVFIADDEAGGVWQTDAGGMCRSLTGAHPDLTETEGIALDSDGNVLVSDGVTRGIYRVNAQGEVADSEIPGNEISKADGMVFASEQVLLIADDEENVVYSWSQVSGLQRLIEGLPEFSPESIAYRQGELYIADSLTGKLYRYTRREGLSNIATFGGSLRSVQGLAFDQSGNLYVAVQTDETRAVGYVVKLRPKPTS